MVDNWFFWVVLIVILFFLIASVIITIIYLISNQEPPLPQKAPVSLIDLEGDPNLYQACPNGTYYLPEYGVIVAQNPVVASLACLNNTILGFNKCEELILPDPGSSETSRAVARKGITLYYVQSSSTSGC